MSGGTSSSVWICSFVFLPHIQGGRTSLTLELRAHDIQSSISFRVLPKFGEQQTHKRSRVLLMYKLNFFEMYVLLYISISNVHIKSYFIEGHVWFGASVPTVQHEVLQSKQSTMEFKASQTIRLTLPTLVRQHFSELQTPTFKEDSSEWAVILSGSYKTRQENLSCRLAAIKLIKRIRLQKVLCWLSRAPSAWENLDANSCPMALSYRWMPHPYWLWVILLVNMLTISSMELKLSRLKNPRLVC